jgi:exoribonuclease II
MKHVEGSARDRLLRIARRALVERGFSPDFSAAVEREVAALPEPDFHDPGIRDLTRMLWCSIDNEESRDLDQLTVVEPQGSGAATILVAIADVDAWVPRHTEIDRHAQQNATSVYAGVAVFPMLPFELSTDITSLNEGVERLAMVTAVSVDANGLIVGEDVYRARVRNHAKLNYGEVGAWLEGVAPQPAKVAALPGLDAQLWIQDQLAQLLRAHRQEHGALDLETAESRAVFEGNDIKSIEAANRGRAKELIEDFMIATNCANARFLKKNGFASIRRVVRSPKRWSRIVAIARQRGAVLPELPDPVALEQFLRAERAKSPQTFGDLSLIVVKLLGAGEYAVERAGDPPIGHFGLAVKDYTHSTAPNRRYPDVVTQRLLKAAIGEAPPPYSIDDLEELARHSTEQQDDASKVERQVRKSAAALLLEDRLGETFPAVITGASDKGTWVRTFRPPVEGKLIRGSRGADVGEKVRVRLKGVDVDRGHIDFERA